MNKIKLITCLCSASLLSSTLATGIQTDTSTPAVSDFHPVTQGYFVSGGLGTIFVIADIGNTLNYSGQSGGFGGILTLGYQTGPNFAIELNTLYSSIKSDDSYDDSRQTASGFLIGPAIKGIAMLGSRVKLYGRIGLGYVNGTGTRDASDPDDSDNHSYSGIFPYDGLGFSVAITPKIDIGVDYTGIIAFVANIGLATANVTYHF